jgi:ABC-type lipoprotein release transport system permease subunit
MLHGVTPNDPATIVVVTASLLIVALCASWIPARRATRIDPSSALRAE